MKFRKSTSEIDIRGSKRPKNPNYSDSNLQTFQKTKNYWNRLTEPKVTWSQTLPLSGGGSPPIVSFWHYRTSDHNSYITVSPAYNLLPVTILGYEFKMTYLRAPWIISNIIAYLSFSVRGHFLCQIFLKDFVYASRNLILKIDTLELNKQTRLRDWDRLFLLFQINHDIVNSTHDFSENTNEQLMSNVFLTFAEAL